MVESWLIKAFARHFLRALEEGDRSIEKHFRECLDKKCRKGLLVAWNDQQVSVASGLDGIGAEGEGQRPCSPTGHRSAPLGNAAPALSSPHSSPDSCLLFIAVFFTRFRVRHLASVHVSDWYNWTRAANEGHLLFVARVLSRSTTLGAHILPFPSHGFVFSYTYCTLLSKITRFRFPLL